MNVQPRPIKPRLAYRGSAGWRCWCDKWTCWADTAAEAYESWKVARKVSA